MYVLQTSCDTSLFVERKRKSKRQREQHQITYTFLQKQRTHQIVRFHLKQCVVVIEVVVDVPSQTHAALGVAQ